jgi:alkylhydroperoxidase family enzyme
MPRVSAAEAGIPDDVRAVCDRLTERYGSLPFNHAVLARRPAIFRGFRGMWEALEASGLLSARMVDLVNLKVASLIGCRLCMELNSAWSRSHGVSADELDALADPGRAAEFSERERAALVYAETLATADTVPESVFEPVKRHFSEDEIVELTALITFEVCVAKFNCALEIEGQGICSVR